MTLGVPYLVVMWAALVASMLTFGDPGSGVGPMILWTVIWYTVLYRVWRGGRLAIGAVSMLTTFIPAVVLFGSIMLVALVNSSGLPGMMGELPATFYVGLIGYAGALVVGIGLRRQEVREWSLALHPPKSRAEAAFWGAPPETDSAAPTPPAEPMTIDLGAGIRKQAQFRIGCFGVLLAFFPGIPFVIGLVQFVRDGHAEMLLAFSAFLAVFAVAVTVSYLRFRRRLGDGGTLRIDERGLTFVVGAERAELPWTSLDGVGISYYVATTRSGKKLHQPQLDVFQDPTYSSNRNQILTGLHRTERPPTPQLPPERYRLMLPAADDVHRTIENAVRGYRPPLWLGWFERTRSDSPWFLW